MRRSIVCIRFVLLALIALSTLPAKGQILQPRFFDYPQNHLDWFTIESEHFQIHFQEGNDRTAQQVSRIAEEVYKPITELYQFEPNTQVHIILRDRQDYANGAAYFYDNKIEIWVSALDSPLRGTTDWFRNVITHEFTHIVQVQASMKRDRKVPGWYLQWLEYENVRRPDVLYGFPTGLVSMPFLSINMPAWFSEGTAQFMRAGIHYDRWDSHRDMILRLRMLSNTTLSLTQMGNFSSNTSLENETVYNQGYAFSLWMAEKYGEEILGEITRNMSIKGVNRIEKGIELATGIPGDALFETFVEERTAFYTKAVENIKMPVADTLQDVGFANFYATFTPDGRAFGYLSNLGRDYYTMRMVMDTLDAELSAHTLFEGPLNSQHSAHHHQMGHNHSVCLQATPVLNIVHDAFDFSPDGNKVVYAARRLNARGESFKDLYLFDLVNGERRKLFNLEIAEKKTENARIFSPTWHPTDPNRVAALQVSDNTLNLVEVDLEKNESTIQPLSQFSHNEQLFRPQWHPDGTKIYFAYTDGAAREIRMLDLGSMRIERILGGGSQKTAVDYRDPVISPDGKHLYYAADHHGIFNIYRVEIDRKGKVQPTTSKQLTNVMGGAFMPDINQQGDLIWSEYTYDGYKLLRAKVSDLVAASDAYNSYAPDEDRNFQKYAPIDPALAALNEMDPSHIAKIETALGTEASTKSQVSKDDLITGFDQQALAIADTGTYAFMIPTLGGDDKRELRPYEETFLKFSWYPVARFDNYNRPKGANGRLLTTGRFGDLGYNLGRDFKFGTYFSSREVTENLSLFGGVMFAPASREATSVGNFFSPTRITELDRDIVLTAEYRGLPFIKKRWSPTIQINLFNLRRNVDSGLSITEHPCTSCAPDTTTADIAFNVWQADINFISKLNEWNLIQLGVSFSPYRVITESFFSREFQEFIPSSSAEYFRATTYTLAYIYDLIVPTRHADISPVGFRGFFRMNYQPARLLDNYRIENGTLVPVFERNQNVSLEAFTRYGFPIKGKTTGMLFSRVFSYLNDPESLFFADYFGGITGIRSYPFFALGGNTTAFSVLSVLTPLKDNMDLHLGRYHIDKVFARFFAEFGSGWGANLGYNGALRKGLGAELRVNTTGQYILPNKFFISGSYGLDRFTLRLDDEFVSDENRRNVTYGGEWLIHFGFTFDFDLN